MPKGVKTTSQQPGLQEMWGKSKPTKSSVVSSSSQPMESTKPEAAENEPERALSPMDTESTTLPTGMWKIMSAGYH
jgi:hypothetical protein